VRYEHANALVPRSVGALADVNAYGCDAEKAITAATKIAEPNQCVNGTVADRENLVWRLQGLWEAHQIISSQAMVFGLRLTSEFRFPPDATRIEPETICAVLSKADCGVKCTRRFENSRSVQTMLWGGEASVTAFGSILNASSSPRLVGLSAQIGVRVARV
jgi:hypothetical protein